MTEQTHRYPCPCCGFPSLSGLIAATCSICWWEADGLDLFDDEVRGSPNVGYSLRQAQQNFQQHGHMYDAGEATKYLAEGSEGRDRLMAYVSSVQRGKTNLDQATLDRLITEECAYWPWQGQALDLQDEETMLRILLA